MLPPLASRMALRRRALASGSPPPVRAATVISLINFVNNFPRLASSAPFLCLILCHLECPDIIQILLGILCGLLGPNYIIGCQWSVVSGQLCFVLGSLCFVLCPLFALVSS